jgi:glycyl-tRNA synthetase beta subunit
MAATRGRAREAPGGRAAHDLQGFLLDRCATCSSRAASADEVDAVLARASRTRSTTPGGAAAAARARPRARGGERGLRAPRGAFKRAKNILGEQEPSAVVAALFEHDAERGLHDAVAELRADGDYEARLRALAGLRGPSTASSTT